jgi:hypothetical protein
MSSNKSDGFSKPIHKTAFFNDRQDSNFIPGYDVSRSFQLFDLLSVCVCVCVCACARVRARERDITAV